MTDSLLEPFRFANGRVSPNRLWVAPMTNTQSHPDGALSDHELGFLQARAEGGFGVVESCATHVTVDGQGWEGEWGIFDDRHEPDWARAASAIQAHNALLFAQIFHGGDRAVRLDGNVPVSAIASGDVGSEEEVRAASGDDIERFIEAFAAAAERAARAGVDGVELHGAHAYLLCQFLRSDNTRTDGWGDTLEGRARLIRTVMQQCRERVPAEFIVGVRLSPENGGFLKGLDLDESVQTAQWLCEDGADFVHLSLWDAHKNTSKRSDEHPVSVFREALPLDVPIITAGKLWSRDDAEKQIALGASAVALGRAAITTADWPMRVVRDGGEPFQPPVTAKHLEDSALGPRFVEYMKRWPGFVRPEDGGRDL
jgi:2,4-dienoyl-CoA reductase-like NADH-dependent reductase (Old Yellow Enzyme family)